MHRKFFVTHVVTCLKQRNFRFSPNSNPSHLFFVYVFRYDRHYAGVPAINK